MNNIDYLETAKRHIAQVEGNHPIEYVKTFALLAIANVLIAMAEKMVSE